METNAMQIGAIEDRCPDCGGALSIDMPDEGAELVLECACGTVGALA